MTRRRARSDEMRGKGGEGQGSTARTNARDEYTGERKRRKKKKEYSPCPRVWCAP